MQLWEDQKVVQALEHILKGYDYLEYDKEASKRLNALKVKVKGTHLNAKRDISVAGNICSALPDAWRIRPTQKSERHFDNQQMPFLRG